MRNKKNLKEMATSKITAVVVTYNVNEMFENNIDSLHRQVGAIIIVDNGSKKESLFIIEKVKAKYRDVVLIKNKENLGLSKAQNIGIKKALGDKSCNWILLLDDDSSLDKNMTEAMLLAYQNNEEKDKVGLITPRIKDINSGKDYPCLIKKNNFIFQRYFLQNIKYKSREEYKNGLFCALSSGSLIKRQVFEDIGLMNEAYFIDFIDWDFAIRLQKSGKIIMCAVNAILFHRLGDKTSHTFLGKEFVTTNQPPHRHFTSCKNRIFFIRNYFFSSPAILLYVFMSLGYEIILISLFEKDKFTKLLEMFNGTLRGLFDSCKNIIPKI